MSQVYEKHRKNACALIFYEQNRIIIKTYKGDFVYKTLLKARSHKAFPMLFAAVILMFASWLGVRFDTGVGTAAGAKNVIIIMTDDQAYESANGPYSVMRNLNSNPYGDWVNFTNAFANASICCPSRASVLTGQDSFHTGVTGNSEGGNLEANNTLPVWLNNAGYRTGLYGKYLNNWPIAGEQNPPPGWDEFNTNGTTDVITDRAVNFINTSNAPYFLYVAYKAPHWPAKDKTPTRYQNATVPIAPDPPNFDEADVSDKPRWVRELPRLSSSDITFIRNERLWSQRSLLAVDDGIKSIMDTLAAKGQLNDTMVIFMSDHGYSFGSHRHINKFCAYEECSRMPLAIRYPGAGASRSDNRLVSNLDIAATVGEFTGVNPGLLQDGRSLVPVLTNTAASWPNELLLEKLANGTRQNFWAIRVPGWKYVEYENGDKEFYDLTNDPYELTNQVNSAAYQTKKAELDARLDAIKP